MAFYKKMQIPSTTTLTSFLKTNNIIDDINWQAIKRPWVLLNSVRMGNTLHQLVISLSLSLSLPSEDKNWWKAADKLIKLWDSRTGEFLQNFEGHTKGISDIAWSSSSDLLASGSDDKTVRLWNVNTVTNKSPNHFYTNLPIGRMCQNITRAYKLCILSLFQSCLKSSSKRIHGWNDPSMGR